MRKNGNQEAGRFAELLVVGESWKPERGDPASGVGGVAVRTFPRSMTGVEVGIVSGGGIREPFLLLENSLRDGEPLSDEFVSRIVRLVGSGDMEILAARDNGRAVGVLVLAFRPNVSLGGDFASIEELYVEPDARRRSIGRKLLEAVPERCRERGVSYVEAHVEEDEAMAFYARLGYEKEGGVQVFSRSYPIPDSD